MITTRILTLCSCLAILAATPLALADDDPNLDAIEARQSYMQVVKWNAGPLFGMAKGDVEFNPELAAVLASNLAALSSMDIGNMWVAGSDNEAYPDDSRALPAIWEPDSMVGEKYQDWVDAVTALQVSSLDDLRSGIGDVGEGCKGCHDDYRAKDD